MATTVWTTRARAMLDAFRAEMRKPPSDEAVAQATAAIERRRDGGQGRRASYARRTAQRRDNR